jgi:hypothetical protein
MNTGSWGASANYGFNSTHIAIKLTAPNRQTSWLGFGVKWANVGSALPEMNGDLHVVYLDSTSTPQLCDLHAGTRSSQATSIAQPTVDTSNSLTLMDYTIQSDSWSATFVRALTATDTQEDESIVVGQPAWYLVAALTTTSSMPPACYSFFEHNINSQLELTLDGSCPNGCSGNGVCDLGSGTCNCTGSHFTGSDCSERMS